MTNTQKGYWELVPRSVPNLGTEKRTYCGYGLHYNATKLRYAINFIMVVIDNE